MMTACQPASQPACFPAILLAAQNGGGRKSAQLNERNKYEILMKNFFSLRKCVVRVLGLFGCALCVYVYVFVCAFAFS